MAELLERKHLKAAAGAVRTLDLHEEFPHAVSMYRASTVRQLLARGKWSIAAEWASEDGPLQLEARTLLEPGILLYHVGRFLVARRGHYA